MAKGKGKATPATIKGGNGLKMRPGTYSGYEVLQWVIRKVEEEPKRLNMNDWVFMFKGKGRGYTIRARDTPRCNTVACMAGWAGMATGDAHVTGSWAGLRSLGLENPKLRAKFETLDPFDNPVAIAESDLSDLFMMTKAAKRVVIAQAKALAEQHKPVLQAAKVKVKAGWQKGGGRV